MGVLAYFVFSMHDATIKWLVVDIPVWQILFVRSVTALVICMAIGGRPLLDRAASSRLKAQLAFRGVVMLTAWLCYYSAARSLPLGQLLTLYFAAPVMITLMAGRILKEHVTRARWISVGIGFVGVLCASDPSGLHVSFAALLVLVAAGFWGYGVILMRQIARQEPTMLQMLSTNSIFCLATGTMCLSGWQPVAPPRMAALVGVGILGSLAQYLVLEAARRIPASVMATVEYTALPWAFLLGYVIWLDVPPPPVVVGAGLIVLAGALLVRAERQS